MQSFLHHPEIIFSLISICALTTLSLLLILKRKSRGGLSFISVTLAIGLWQAGKLIKNLPLVIPIETDPLFWSKVSFTGASLIYSTFFRFCCKLSFRERGVYKILIYIAFATSFIFIALEHMNLLSLDERLTPYGYYKVATPLYTVYLFTYLLFMGMGLFILYPRNDQRIPQLRIQSLYIFLGALLGFGTGCLEFWGIYFEPLYPISDLSPCLFGGIIYWAIYRFNIMGGGQTAKKLIMQILYFALLFTLIFTIYHASTWLAHIAGYYSVEIFSGNFLLIFICTGFLYALTPLAGFITRGIRRRFFPVRFSYRTLYTTLSEQLSEVASPEDMLKLLLSRMEKEYGYEKGRSVLFEYKNNIFYRSSPNFAGQFTGSSINTRIFETADLSDIICRKQLLLALRTGQFGRQNKHHILMQLRVLNRFHADLVLPVKTKSHLMGLMLFNESAYHAESWHVVKNILSSVLELLGSHLYQHYLLKARAQQEHLTRAGMMSAAMAHEIKNPLEGIYGAAQILKENPDNPHKFIDMILSDSVRLSHTVRRFLEFSHPFKINIRSVNIAELLQDFISRQNQVEADKDKVIILDLNNCDIIVECDPDGIGQILLNLVLNAKRYQPPGINIRLRAYLQGSNIQINIEDDGPGIRPAVQDKIFEPFFTTSTKGTGLGLAISRKIAKEMGGDLYFIAKEQGAIFTLQLPITQVTTKDNL